MLHAGLDLSRKRLDVCLIGEGGELVGELDLVFEAAALRADPGLTLLLATADQGSPTEAALRRLAAKTARVD
jgi:hypothetical protein